MEIDTSAGPTVGREPELGELEAALDALEGGRSRWLAVAGEPGIGKTRLLAELRSRGEERGHLVLTGSAAEFEREVPFSVWVDALDAYVASQAGDAWEPDLTRELGQTLPSLRRPGADGAPAIADERYRAHRAVRRLLELFATDRPLVLVLDDLHWADAASVEPIASLLRRGPAAPVLLALAFRRGQASQRLAAALAVPGVRRIELAHLTEAQSAELLTGLDRRSLSAIYRRGGGNPFYLEQLARADSNGSPSAPRVASDENGGDAVPAAVAASIADELGSLTAPTRLFLDGAAIAGEPFARGGWRLAAHARAAAVLARQGAAAADRAHHVEQSATHGDADAIELFLEAGHSVAPRAPAAAARWFGAALRLLPGDDRERQVEVRVALTSALRSLGELEQCRATLLETIELLAPEDLSRRIALTAQCAAVEHWLGRHEEAHRRLAKTLEQLQDHHTADAATLQIELVVDGIYEMDLELATAMGEAALKTACRLDDPALIVAAASALCLAEMATGATEAASPHRELALAQLERLSDAELAPRLEALYHLSWAENYLERYDDAIAHADRGVALARATGQGRLLMPLMLVKTYPLEMQGRLAEVIELCEAAVEGARLSTNPHYLFWALFELGWAHYYAGDLSAAMAAGDESARVGRRMSGGTMPSAGGGPGWCLAVSALESGDAERARKIMREVGGEDMAAWIPAERCFNWENLVLAELALGRLDAADRYARRSEENAAALGLRLPASMAGRTRATVQLAAGDPHAAARSAQASLEAAEAIGAQLQVGFSRSLLGRSLAAAGERDQAVAALRQAEHELDACGSVRTRDEVRRELRKLGVRVEPRAPARPRTAAWARSPSASARSPSW